MDAGEFIALGAALVAAVVAIAVPVWTFKRTLELERIKWVRDRRAQLYIDILAEAYAEKQWFLDLMTRREITLIEERDGGERRGPSQVDFPPGPDLRLGPAERSKLGARGAVFASTEVSKAFNAFSGVLGRCSLTQPQSEGEAHIAKVQADELFRCALDRDPQRTGRRCEAEPRTADGGRRQELTVLGGFIDIR